MKRPILMITVVVALAASWMLAGTAFSDDQSRDRPFRNAVVDTGNPSDGGQGRALLQYDDGVPVYRDGGVGPFPHVLFIGNFVSPGLPPAPPYSVTAASVNMAGFYGTRFYMGFFRSPSHPTNPLQLLGTRAVAGTATGWNSVLFATPVISDAPFLVGVVNTNFGPCSGSTAVGSTCEGVALGPGTNLGYGHNAMRITWPNASGTVGTGYASIAGQNALIRLNGYVPVELMRVEVD
jgi:hypothetical protein